MPYITAFTVLQICAKIATDWFMTTIHSQKQNGFSPPPEALFDACYLQYIFPKMRLKLKGKTCNDVL
jgi:hypothetical protein